MRVVVLGAGVGGLVASQELRKRLGPEHEIVVVDRQSAFHFAPSFLWVVFGTRRPEQVTRRLDFLRRKRISLLTANVEWMDPAKRVVRTSRGDLAADVLIVALGAELAPEKMPGFEGAHTFYTLSGAVALRKALEAFSGGRIVLMIASTPFRCPAAPYEAAFMLDAHLRRRGLRDRSPVIVVTPEPQPMPVAGPAVGATLVDMMRARGIQYRAKTKPEAVLPDERVVVLAGGERVPYDLLIGVPPHVAPAVVRESGLADTSGYVPVTPGTLETSAEGVYAIGDVAAVKLANGMMLPKAGVFAHYEAEVVARNVAAGWTGQGRTTYDGHGACWVEVGNGRAAFGSGNFYAPPAPAVAMKPVSRYQHWRKVAFEKLFLRKWT